MMNIETIRLSEKAKSQLITLKRRTGIQNWNVLCRWALLLSLKDSSNPPNENISLDSNVEMSWKTFAGELGGVLQALIAQRLHNVDGYEIDPAKQVVLHMHRGISYLATKDIDSINDIFSMSIASTLD